MRKFGQFIGDFWEAIGAVLGAAIIAYEFVAQLYAGEGLSLNNAVWLGLGIFVFFMFLAFIKAIRKTNESKNYKPNNLIQGDAIIGEQIANSPIIKAEGQSKAAGGDIVETHHHHYQNEKSNSKVFAKLNIVAESKLVGGWSHVIVSITNKEQDRILCRAEIYGIHDETGKNITREISQHANHFSWSGGRADEEGNKSIAGGLDGTINISYISGYSFCWGFHEEPDKSWPNDGVYSVVLGIRGNLGGSEFFGENVTLKFKYKQEIIPDGEGGIDNKSELELLEWSIKSQRLEWETIGD